MLNHFAISTNGPDRSDSVFGGLVGISKRDCSLRGKRLDRRNKPDIKESEDVAILREASSINCESCLHIQSQDLLKFNLSVLNRIIESCLV